MPLNATHFALSIEFWASWLALGGGIVNSGYKHEYHIETLTIGLYHRCLADGIGHSGPPSIFLYQR